MTFPKSANRVLSRKWRLAGPSVGPQARAHWPKTMARKNRPELSTPPGPHGKNARLPRNCRIRLLQAVGCYLYRGTLPTGRATRLKSSKDPERCSASIEPLHGTRSTTVDEAPSSINSGCWAPAPLHNASCHVRQRSPARASAALRRQEIVDGQKRRPVEAVGLRPRPVRRQSGDRAARSRRRGAESKFHIIWLGIPTG